MERSQLVNLLQAQHGLVSKGIEGLSDEQLTAIPEGFNNNILWNVGHIAYVMSSLVYRPAGKDMIIPESHAELFKNGSSPADWAEAPSIPETLETFKASVPKACEDLMSGALDGYNAFDLFPGLKLESVDQALAFHLFHAGLHASVSTMYKKMLG